MTNILFNKKGYFIQNLIAQKKNFQKLTFLELFFRFRFRSRYFRPSLALILKLRLLLKIRCYKVIK